MPDTAPTHLALIPVLSKSLSHLQDTEEGLERMVASNSSHLSRPSLFLIQRLFVTQSQLMLCSLRPSLTLTHN